MNPSRRHGLQRLIALGASAALAYPEAFAMNFDAARIDALVDALDVLVHSPHIGRPVRGGKRELVIGSGADGYVALYRHVARVDTVFVLAFRHQREASYSRRAR
jgi:plasmid stabilization system protein ParE